VAGGELQVWEQSYEGEAEVDTPPAGGELCTYKAGDLVVIDSWRLHQIMPFTGALDRISATLHAVYVKDPEPESDSGPDPAGPGHWEVWF